MSDSSKKSVLVVDGNSIINRAYYGIRMLTTKDGLCTNAVYGMITMLHKQIEAINPTHCAIAFDLKEPTFRHKMYDGYKANRKGMPEELAMQLPYIRECATALGFKIIEKPGFEADDILGTVSKFAKDDCKVYIYTGDRDSLQLIDENSYVLLAGNKDTVLYDKDVFEEKYNIKVAQFVDLKALMGDASDNIPGVSGIGEKTATKLINEFGSLEGIYDDFEESKLSDGVKSKIRDGRENAFMSRKLAKICCDVDIGYTLNDLEYCGINNDLMLSLCKKLEFSALIKKMNLNDNSQSIESKSMDTDYIFKNVSYDTINELEGLCAFSYHNNNLYVVSQSDSKNVMVCKGEFSDVAGFLNSDKVKLICYDAKNFYKQFKLVGINCNDIYFDVMLGAYVLDASDNFDIEHLVGKYLDEKYSIETPNAVYVMRLYDAIHKFIDDRNEHDLLFDIEMPLSKVLANMEISGFKLDLSGLSEYSEYLYTLEKEIEERIYCYAGEEFNINSPKQLSEVLFEKLLLPSTGKKTKTGYSTNAEALEKLKPYHPIIDDLLEYRKVAKLKSTYADGLVKTVDKDGKVRTTFKQTGTATGRLSSADPNLQNIPIRTEMGNELRKYFLPESNEYILLDADYSQIELRLLADISKDENMIKAFISGEDIHSTTASAVFNVPLDEVSYEQRKKAKAVNFGIVYGISAFSLSQDLGISQKKAKEYIESYFKNYPKVKEYLDSIVIKAYNDGYVTTPFGRRRYIPELKARNKNLNHFGERVAMNSPIQGSAADIIKIAMINVDKKLRESGCDARMILQVHDEIIIESNKKDKEKVSKILQFEMENAVKLSVPLIAEVHSGEDWYSCK